MLNFINLLFYKVLYMSIIGIFVGIFILIFRKCFDKKISPKWKCIIWILLLISLLVPIKIEFQTQNSNMEVLSISGLIEPIQNISGNSYTSENEELKSIEKNAEIKSEISEIKENNYVLTPGRYVGTKEVEDDGIPFCFLPWFQSVHLTDPWDERS